MIRYARHGAPWAISEADLIRGYRGVTDNVSWPEPIMALAHELATPFGPMDWNPELRRVGCSGERCIVQIPDTKPSGLCYGCEGRADRQEEGT